MGQTAEAKTSVRIPKWDELVGQDRIRDSITAAVRSGRLSGSFLFVGPEGCGKETVAKLIAQTLFCETNAASEMSPCGECPSCLQVVAGTHPDLIHVRKPADRVSIPLELLIGPADARMSEGFCRDIRIRPSQGDRKIAILSDADYLAEESANCLLKTIEEPPTNAIVILIATNEQRQLPTIRSRCRIVRLGPLPILDAIQRIHARVDTSIDDEEIRDAIEQCSGDLDAAVRVIEGIENGEDDRDLIRQSLAKSEIDPVELSKQIQARTEPYKNDAPRRRDALKDSFAIAISHFRSELRQEATAGNIRPETMRRLDRSLRAIREVDRMANASTLVDCFATDIAIAVTGDRGDIGS